MLDRKQYNRSWYNKNKDKVLAYKREWEKSKPDYVLKKTLRQKFDLTLEQYKELLAKQNNVCAICKQPEIVKYKNGKLIRLSVDHCHQTNIIRGLLCKRCNTGLGGFMDSLLLIKSAQTYIEDYGFLTLDSTIFSNYQSTTLKGA